MAGVEFIKYTPGKTVRVKIRSSTKVRGQHLHEGKVFELPEQEGMALIVAGKAERYTEPPKLEK